MQERERVILRTTAVGSAVNVALTVVKLAAGVLGRSSAMIADAVHSLSDLVSDAVVLLFVRIAGKPEDFDHAYGHGKYETLATVIIGLILLGVGVGLAAGGVWEVWSFCHGSKLASPNWWALGAAVLSLVVKELLFRYTMRNARRVGSPVLEANAWHHRSDAYTSVATLAGIGGAMLLGPSWRVLDPLAAAFVSVFIIAEALRLIKPAVDELLEKSLPPTEVEAIGRIIASTPGIMGYHRLRTRRVGANVALSVHIKMDGSITLHRAHAIASDLEGRLRAEYGPASIVIIHMEPGRG